MKSTIEFDLDSDIERINYRQCMEAQLAFGVLQEFGDHLRAIRKYGNEEYNIETVSKLEKRFWDLIKENGITEIN